jgi:hypothetical protein
LSTASEAASTAMQVDSREYKIILDVRQFENMKGGIAEISKALNLAASEIGLICIELSKSKNRLVRFIDTADFFLYKNTAYILRERINIGKEGSLKSKAKITLKYRQKAPIDTTKKKDNIYPDESIKWKEVGSKYEEDIVPPDASKYSYSINVTLERKVYENHLDTVKKAEKLFPVLKEVLGQDRKKLIVVNQFYEIAMDVFTLKFDPKLDADPNSNASMEAGLTFWYTLKKNQLDKDLYGKDELKLVEFSYKLDNQDFEVMGQQAEKLFKVLQRDKLFNFLQQKKTKTHFAYETSPHAAN